MCYITHAKIIALLGATAISFVFGYLWYGPIFGKTWAGLMGIKLEEGKCGKPPISSLAITFLGAFLTVFVMAYIINIYKPACTFYAAFLVWLGFYVPTLLGTVTWEGRPWALFALNGLYSFLSLQLITTVLTYWR